jgi:hypothetical protein
MVAEQSAPWVAFRGELTRWQVVVDMRLPNMRVQRTRSSPSAPHSPLTRKPLGSHTTPQQLGARGPAATDAEIGDIILVFEKVTKLMSACGGSPARSTGGVVAR